MCFVGVNTWSNVQTESNNVHTGHLLVLPSVKVHCI